MKRYLAFVIGVLVGAMLITLLYFNRLNIMDYYEIDKAMLKAEYEKVGQYEYHKIVSGKIINIKFDFSKNICNKNNYEFSIKDSFQSYGKRMYIKGERLSDIVNYQFEHDCFSNILARQIDYTQIGWTNISLLVAHAGGSVREADYSGTYTNSLEALIQNYNLGHRVFEFDFYLTSDNKLACVHDWKQFGNMDGKAYSEEQWLKSKTVGSPATESKYSTMMIDKLMDEMIVNPDIFIVTDTKLTDERSKLQFQLIYDAAMDKSPELLNRFIPQIYNDEMYGYVSEVYNFSSIIYTTYATKNSSEEIISFSKAHNNIKVITHYTEDVRFNASQHKRIHDAGKLVFVHTINSYEDIATMSKQGIDGFYTDILLPQDFEIYNKYKNTNFK